MTLFQSIRKNKRSKKCQIGLCENAEWRCLVWQSAENAQPQVVWQKVNEPLEMALQQAVRSGKNFTIIRPLPHQYLWRKTVYLPELHNPQLIYKQVIQILTQELPLPLNEVYFDFQVEQKRQAQLTQIRLFAVRKHFADQYHFPDATILDCELHCYWRGLAYLFPDLTHNALKIADLIFAFTQKGLCFSASENHEHIIDINQLPFAEKPIQPALYLCALGASLWNGKE